MTKQSFAASYKYQVRRMIFKPIITVIASIATLFLMTGFINYAADGKFSFEGFGLPFVDIIPCFALFIFGAGCFNEFINAGAANGVSRTTSFISAVASNFTVSAAAVLFTSVFSLLVNLILPDSEDMLLVELLYGERGFYKFYGENAFVVRIRFFVMITLAAFLCAIVGIILAAAVYKLSRLGSMIFAVILVFIPCIGFPTASVYLANKGIDVNRCMKEFMTAVGRCFGMAHVNGSQAGNCIQGGAVMLLASAVLGFFAWLIVRRADAKPAAVRGE